MNQLFDGHGDKTSLTQLQQRYVPINSTSMCLGVQPQQSGWTVDLLRDFSLQLLDHSGIIFLKFRTYEIFDRNI